MVFRIPVWGCLRGNYFLGPLGALRGDWATDGGRFWKSMRLKRPIFPVAVFSSGEQCFGTLSVRELLRVGWRRLPPESGRERKPREGRRREDKVTRLTSSATTRKSP